MMRLKDLKMKPKLIALFLIAGVVPLFFVGLACTWLANNSLMDAAFNQLVAVHEIKKDQIQNFIRDGKADINVFSGNNAVRDALISFEAAYGDGGHKGESWNAVNETYKNIFHNFKEEYNYDDILLISLNGDVIFSVNRDKDLGQNLVNGELASSNLASGFKYAKDSLNTLIEDWNQANKWRTVEATIVQSKYKLTPDRSEIKNDIQYFNKVDSIVLGP